MNREVYVRFCEGVGVKFPRATRPLIHTLLKFNLARDVEKKKAGPEPRLNSQHNLLNFILLSACFRKIHRSHGASS